MCAPAQMSLRGAGKWKSVDLFEREARLLRGLEHPGIPTFVDAFNLDTATDRTYVLVQRLAPGASLQALVDGGAWRPDEKEIRRIARALLDILAYLHARRPPVVHRDVKVRAPNSARGVCPSECCS
jgi:serine/threonine protein kinase